jgi:histidine triad (HIT) family protein
MENCIFCKIIKGEIPCVKIWEDEKHLAFLDLGQISPGHTLVIPKKHTDYIFDLEDDEYCELLLKGKEIAKKLKLKLNPKRVGLAVEGFGVPHVHLHMVPLNNGNELNPERATNPPIEELEKIAKIINA